MAESDTERLRRVAQAFFTHDEVDDRDVHFERESERTGGPLVEVCFHGDRVPPFTHQTLADHDCGARHVGQVGDEAVILTVV